MAWALLAAALFFICQAFLGFALMMTADNKDCDLWVSSAVLFGYIWIILIRDFALWQKHIRIGFTEVVHLWQVPDLIIVPCLLLWLRAEQRSEDTKECTERSEGFSGLSDVGDIAIVALSSIYAVRLLIFIVHSATFIHRSVKQKQSFKRFCSDYFARLRYIDRQGQMQPMQENNKAFGELSAEARTTSDCVICCEPFQDESIVLQLKCAANHIFHATCLQGWLSEQFTCPICRVPTTFQ